MPVFLRIDTDLRSKLSNICWGQNGYRSEYNHPLVKMEAIKCQVRSLDFPLTSYKVSTSLKEQNTLFISCLLYLHHSASDSLICFDGKTKHHEEVAPSTLVLALQSLQVSLLTAKFSSTIATLYLISGLSLTLCSQKIWF